VLCERWSVTFGTAVCEKIHTFDRLKKLTEMCMEKVDFWVNCVCVPYTPMKTRHIFCQRFFWFFETNGSVYRKIHAKNREKSSFVSKVF
jgi:hypothetical protein